MADKQAGRPQMAARGAPSPVVLEERERVVVQDLNGGHRHLAGLNKDPEESAILSA